MSRARPLRKETALQIGIDKTLLDLHALVRINQVHQREKASESIPEPGVGRHVAWLHLSVVRAVVDALAIGIDLGQIAREKERAVEARVECADPVNVSVADLDAAERGVPAVAAGILHGVERLALDFAEIELGLVNADERRSHAEVHHLSPDRLEAHHRKCVVSGGFHLSGHLVSGDCLRLLERCVRNHHEPVLEILRHTAVIVCHIADYLVLLRDHLHE